MTHEYMEYGYRQAGETWGESDSSAVGEALPPTTHLDEYSGLEASAAAPTEQPVREEEPSPDQ